MKGCSSSPPEQIVRQWLKAISDQTGTHIAYSPEVYKTIVNRTNYINILARKRRVGGKQLEKFYSSKWTFRVPDNSCQVAQAEKEQLRHKLNAVEEQVKKLQHQLQPISANRIPTKRKNPNDCSERHVRRLKKQRTDSCSASLEWLQREGYKPVKLEVQKIEDGKTFF